ncbi:hypothetical protein V1511DRAFT_495104 [Dipodascopsis uninucleata]
MRICAMLLFLCAVSVAAATDTVCVSSVVCCECCAKFHGPFDYYVGLAVSFLELADGSRHLVQLYGFLTHCSHSIAIMSAHSITPLGCKGAR